MNIVNSRLGCIAAVGQQVAMTALTTTLEWNARTVAVIKNVQSHLFWAAMNMRSTALLSDDDSCDVKKERWLTMAPVALAASVVLPFINYGYILKLVFSDKHKLTSELNVRKSYLFGDHAILNESDDIYKKVMFNKEVENLTEMHKQHDSIFKHAYGSTMLTHIIPQAFCLAAAPIVGLTAAATMSCCILSSFLFQYGLILWNDRAPELSLKGLTFPDATATKAYHVLQQDIDATDSTIEENAFQDTLHKTPATDKQLLVDVKGTNTEALPKWVFTGTDEELKSELEKMTDAVLKSPETSRDFLVHCENVEGLWKYRLHVVSLKMKQLVALDIVAEREEGESEPVFRIRAEQGEEVCKGQTIEAMLQTRPLENRGVRGHGIDVQMLTNDLINRRFRVSAGQGENEMQLTLRGFGGKASKDAIKEAARERLVAVIDAARAIRGSKP